MWFKHTKSINLLFELLFFKALQTKIDEKQSKALDKEDRQKIMKEFVGSALGLSFFIVFAMKVENLQDVGDVDDFVFSRVKIRTRQFHQNFQFHHKQNIQPKA